MGEENILPLKMLIYRVLVFKKVSRRARFSLNSVVWS